MVAQEFHEEQPVEENSTTELQDPYEAEETLSLCDLPINSNEADCDDFSKAPQSLSSDQDFFEFFSEDFSTASTCPAENIIFCGKLIPYKEPPVSEFKSQKLDSNTEQNLKKRSLFRWKSDSYTKLKTSSLDDVTGYKSCAKQRRVASSKSLPTSASENYRFANRKCKFSVRKVSILDGKSRWYFFMFGMGRFPIEMNLRDMKTRQSRRSPSTTFRSFDGGEKVEGKRSRPRKGLWGLLRALVCSRSQHANAVADESFGCIPTW